MKTTICIKHVLASGVIADYDVNADTVTLSRNTVSGRNESYESQVTLQLKELDEVLTVSRKLRAAMNPIPSSWPDR